MIDLLNVVQSPLAVETVDEGAQAFFRFEKVQTTGDLLVPLLVLAGLLAYVWWMYRRDGDELPALLRWFLTGMRVLVFAALFVLYLEPQWLLQKEIEQPVRLLMMVDGSGSMGMRDVDEDGRQSADSRTQQVAGALESSDFLEKVRDDAHVCVYRFDTTAERVAQLSRRGDENEEGDDATDSDALPDWDEALAPTGVETRLGEALEQVIAEERHRPISAVVIISDGRQNAGELPEKAVRTARDARIPIYSIGLGTTERPTNVRVVELNAAPRAFPGDPFTVNGLVQLQGGDTSLEGSTVQAELRMKKSDADEAELGALLGRTDVILGKIGESVPIEFVIAPEKLGRNTLVLQVLAPKDDINADDNQITADVEVVDRKDRVLLMASGPCRDYRFLRTQIFRDETMTLDVFLQSGQSNISQEADNILGDFPATKEEMYEYDCVVAFDPDWSALSDAQVDVLERWVSEQGGGLFVTAGMVHAGDPISGWSTDSSMRKIRALYPVEFYEQGSVWENRTQTATEPWPVEFTREGLAAEYLWLDDDAVSSREAWNEFPGVYSFQGVKKLKPSAIELARFSDPRSAAGEAKAVYFAEQFYGSGRVFYAGSNELWRLRRDDIAYFERLTTKLIRHVSQGRQMRSSNRGTLATDRQRYTLGAMVTLRAQLTDSRLEPLDAPDVTLDVFAPDGEASTIELRSDASAPGMFVGQLSAARTGTYRLELAVPESDDERLTRRIQVRAPDREWDDPRQDVALLKSLATDETYFSDVDSALDPENKYGLYPLLNLQPQVSVTQPEPNLQWERLWMGILLALMCGLLCVEWLIRRLARLA